MLIKTYDGEKLEAALPGVRRAGEYTYEVGDADLESLAKQGIQAKEAKDGDFYVEICHAWRVTFNPEGGGLMLCVTTPPGKPGGFSGDARPAGPR